MSYAKVILRKYSSTEQKDQKVRPFSSTSTECQPNRIKRALSLSPSNSISSFQNYWNTPVIKINDEPQSLKSSRILSARSVPNLTILKKSQSESNLKKPNKQERLVKFMKQNNHQFAQTCFDKMHLICERDVEQNQSYYRNRLLRRSNSLQEQQEAQKMNKKITMQNTLIDRLKEKEKILNKQLKYRPLEIKEKRLQNEKEQQEKVFETFKNQFLDDQKKHIERDMNKLHSMVNNLYSEFSGSIQLYNKYYCGTYMENKNPVRRQDLKCTMHVPLQQFNNFHSSRQMGSDSQQQSKISMKNIIKEKIQKNFTLNSPHSSTANSPTGLFQISRQFVSDSKLSKIKMNSRYENNNNNLNSKVSLELNDETLSNIVTEELNQDLEFHKKEKNRAEYLKQFFVNKDMYNGLLQTLQQQQKNQEFNQLTEEQQEFLTAVKKNNIQKVKQIIDFTNNKQLINTIDQHKLTALHFASRRGYIDIVNYLLKNGINSLLKDDMNRTAYDVAMFYQHYKVAQSIQIYNKYGI